jgi:hypothetical protein
VFFAVFVFNRTVLTPRELLEIQAATLFRIDAAGRLICVNEPAEPAAPRVFIGTCASGERIVRVRSDVAAAMVEDLDRCADDASILTCLESAATTHRGPAFVFDEQVAAPREVVAISDPLVLHPALASWTVDIQRGTPLIGVMQAGQVVSICYSSRVGERACEAGVETAPEWRGQGLGRLAVLGWAASVQQSGRLAFYSTTHENLASRRLAAALGLRYFAEDWSLE